MAQKKRSIGKRKTPQQQSNGSGGFFETLITRREFLKKSLLVAGGIAAAAYGIDKIFSAHRRFTAQMKQAEEMGVFQTTDIFRNSAPKNLWKWSKEAAYYSASGTDVQCTLCPHGCILAQGDRGFCRSRVNIAGKLYSLAYGNPCAAHVDPIEKKPLFHFLPQTTAYSIATAGCNFRCLNCQNWTISQFQPEETQNMDMMPDAVVQNARSAGASSIAYTYSEPVTYYEYMHDTSVLARQQGLRNVLVSNAYINEEPLRKLCKVIDAATIDFKGINLQRHRDLTSGDFREVLRSLKILKEEGVWLEVSTLVVPSWTDSLDEIRELARQVYKAVGPDQPFHILRFIPQYKLTGLAQTPVSTLLAARKIAQDEGMRYVYVGNLPGTDNQNTYCHENGELCVERRGYQILKNNVDSEGYCAKCGARIPGVWK